MIELTIQDIVNALNKQQPKKVTVKTTYYDKLIAYDTYITNETKSYRCPTCETNLFHETKYCSECGQKLKWEG
jgi:peptide methionine sulfoxide reductase MsrB